MLQLARTRRPRRDSEWTEAKAVTFIVTLAAARSVTLAAAQAGMSRKAAYALKRRDAGFAAAWNAALAANRPNSREGYKVGEVRNPPAARLEGSNRAKPFDAEMRDIFFAALATPARESRPSSLARARALP